MTIAEDGHTSVSIIAGQLKPSTTHPDRILFMGSSLAVSIDPPTARQWIQALEHIAAKEQ